MPRNKRIFMTPGSNRDAPKVRQCWSRGSQRVYFGINYSFYSLPGPRFRGARSANSSEKKSRPAQESTRRFFAFLAGHLFPEGINAGNKCSGHKNSFKSRRNQGRYGINPMFFNKEDKVLQKFRPNFSIEWLSQCSHYCCSCTMFVRKQLRRCEQHWATVVVRAAKFLAVARHCFSMAGLRAATHKARFRRCKLGACCIIASFPFALNHTDF